MKMPSIESSGLLALVAKYGWIKVLSFGSALIGAGLMAIFRPPKTKKEMFLQGMVALGGSFLLGDFGIELVGNWVDVPATKLVAPVYGLIGALSWGAFGGLAQWRDNKLSKDLPGAIKEASDVLKP